MSYYDNKSLIDLLVSYRDKNTGPKREVIEELMFELDRISEACCRELWRAGGSGSYPGRSDNNPWVVLRKKESDKLKFDNSKLLGVSMKKVRKWLITNYPNVSFDGHFERYKNKNGTIITLDTSLPGEKAIEYVVADIAHCWNSVTGRSQPYVLEQIGLIGD